MRRFCCWLLLTLVAWAHIDLRLGSLRIGGSEAEVVKALGPPKSKTPPVQEAATGDTVSSWNYPGLELYMTKNAKNYTVRGFHLKSPSKLRTDKGVGIGTSESTLIQAYPQAKKQDNSYTWFDEKAYEQAMFNVKAGKVSEIIVMPGPE